MRRNIYDTRGSSKANSAVFAIGMLLLFAGLSAAQTQTFCGTKNCRAARDLQGNYFVEFFCEGEYPVSGTCTGFLRLERFLNRTPQERHA